MASYRYPQQDLDRPAVLSSLLGSFWSRTYDGAAQVEQFAYARAQLEKQSGQNLQEAIDALSRFKVPVYHTDLWYRLVVRESAISDSQIIRYGEGYQYGPQPVDGVTQRYGVPLARQLYRFPLPPGLQRAPLICNRTDAPTVSWQAGLDYLLEDGQLVLHENPFARDDIAQRPVIEDGLEVDREASLWLLRSQWDADYLWAHYGHVLGLDLPSSTAYKNAVNSIWDALVEGNHREAFDALLAAVADVPRVLEAEERVLYTLADRRHSLVITDRNAYRHAPLATSQVAVGDVVRRGDFLTDAVEVDDLNQGQKPDWLFAYALDEQFVDPPFQGIAFFDEEVETVISQDSGFTQLEFPLGGDQTAVAAFWQEVTDRGVAQGQTLAQLLDERAAEFKTGQPPPGALPEMINPLEFLLANIFRGSAVAVSLTPQAFGREALPLSVLRNVRRIMSPYETLLLVLQMLAQEADEQPQDDGQLGTQALAPLLVDDPDALETDLLLPATYVDGICL